MAPVLTRNIIGRSLFWNEIQNGFLFRNSFQRWNFISKWRSCTNKYQGRDKIWLVGVYWSLEKNFSLNLQQNHKKWSPKHCQLKHKQTLTKWRLLFTKSFWFLSNWFGKYLKTTIPLRGYIPWQFASRYIRHYSLPLPGIIVYYFLPLNKDRKIPTQTLKIIFCYTKILTCELVIPVYWHLFKTDSWLSRWTVSILWRADCMIEFKSCGYQAFYFYSNFA